MNGENKCACKDRAATDCPGEWEPGCNLGNNPKHVKVAAQDVPVSVNEMVERELLVKVFAASSKGTT